jgi:hypothetical protein
MALIKKTLFPENLDKYNTFIDDTDLNSKYFNITELPDTFTGGKNAFLIAGSNELVADTVVKVEIKDAVGNIIYYEPGEGKLYSEINGEQFTSEYYEGVSKVVAVYVYPDTTAYGPCTITILGELSSYYDSDGLLSTIPLDWQGTYNVKWQKIVNVNPTLSNTTKIRFYKRPKVTINEILSPIYRIDSEAGLKINTGINQSFADIRISNLETFAGDVKRVKVFRTSLGDISDYDMIQDILVESKELLITYDLSSSVIGNTGVFTPEVLKNKWNSGSLNATLNNSIVEAGVRLTGSGYFTHSQSLDLKSTNTYELSLDAFYSASTDSNLGIYLVSGSTSSSIGTLIGTSPTKNLLDTTIPFTIDRDYPTASLYLSQSQGEWHVGNISLKLSEDTAFSPDAISFITTMPSVVSNQDFNFKFEFYDVNSNYVPVLVTGSANFTGGSAANAKLLTFESDRTAFRFSSGSYANPPSQFVKFKTTRTNFTGSVIYSSASFDINGNYIEPSSYAGTYPGAFQIQSDSEALLSVANFTGSINTVLVGSITFTASCEGFEEYETIYRFEDGDNAPGLFVTSNTNQFIYKATDLSINPAGQIITIEAKRKNLASATTPLTVNSGSGKPPLTFVSTNATNGVNTYTLAGTAYPYGTGETTYFISGSDQFGNEFSDAIKITPVKILDGLSATLTNDNASLPALSTGFVASGSFLLTSGSVNVKVGNETITFDDDNDGNRANNTFAITNLSGIGCTPNVSNPSTNGYGITNLSADSGSLDITISYKDGAGDTTSIVKTATYTKNKKAAPVLEFVIGNNNQSVTAKSTGEQIDAFVNATFAVNESYNGVTTQKTFTPTSITATNSYSGWNATETSLTLPNIANETNSVDISVTGTVVDSENVTRNVYGSISLTKVKKAAPTVDVSASPQTQVVLGTNGTGYTGIKYRYLAETFQEENCQLTGVEYSVWSYQNVGEGGYIIVGRSGALEGGEGNYYLTPYSHEDDTIEIFIGSYIGCAPATTTTTTTTQSPVITQLETAVLRDVVVSAIEGETNRFVSMAVSSSVGLTVTPSINGNIIVMSGTRIVASEASVSVTVTYTDSEGTTRTQLIIIRASTSLTIELQEVDELREYNISSAFKIASLNSATASLYRATASLNAATASFSSSIGWLNLATASFSSSIGWLNQYTQSQDTKNLTLSLVTASYDSRFTTLGGYTGSNDTKWSTLATTTGSLISSASVDASKFLALATTTGSLISSASVDASKFLALATTTGSLISSASVDASKFLALGTLTASYDSRFTTLGGYTGSNDTKWSTLATTTGSLISSASVDASKFLALATTTGSLISSASVDASKFLALATTTGSLISSASVDASKFLALGTLTASYDSRFTTLGGYTGSNDTKWSTLGSLSGSFARTNSANIFSGNQTITGSLFISQNLIVQGSSSIQNISSSTLNIGTNIITVAVNQPAVRFGGIAVIDSGSAGGSGSFLYDSIQDEFIFVHRGNGTNVTSSHFVLGPETYDNLGNEIYLTNNRLPKGTGKQHIIDSQISDDGTTVSIAGNLTITGSINAPQLNAIATITGALILSASADAVSISNLNAFSGSTLVRLTNLESTSASLSSSIGGIFAFTQSQNSKDTTLLSVTASFSSSIGSLNSATASFSSSIGSLNSATASFSSSIGSLNSKTGSFATTGSNTFNGNQTVNGDIAISNGNMLSLSANTPTFNNIRRDTTNGGILIEANEFSTFFKDNGNVGIGTRNPTRKLDVVDSTGIILRHSETVNTAGAFRIIGGSFTGNGMTGLMFNAANGTNQLQYGGGTALAEPASIHLFYVGTYGANGTGTEVMRIDNAGDVGIGTSDPTQKLHVFSTTAYQVQLQRSGVGSALVGISAQTANSTGDLLFEGTQASQGFVFRSRDASNALINSLGITRAGNVGIGVFSPATLLDVRGQISANSGSLTNPAYSFVGDLNTGLYSPSSDTLALVTNGVNRVHVDSNGSVGVGSTSLTGLGFRNSKTITGGGLGFSYGHYSDGQIQSDVTGAAWYHRTQASTQAAAFTLPNLLHFHAAQGTIGSGSIVTTQTGFLADATLVGATSNIGFNGNIPAAANRWNTYMGGTADNYFNGSVGIGVTIPTTKLDVRGQVSAESGSLTNPAYSFVGDLNTGMHSPSADELALVTAGANRVHVDSSGNVGVGTVSPSARLHIDSTGLALRMSRTGYDSYGFVHSVGSGIQFQNFTDNVTEMYFAGNRNVGIGTTSPGARLHIRAENANQLFLDNLGERYTEIDYYNSGSLRAANYYDNTGNEFVIRTTGLANIGFDTNLTRRMTISSNGNVGIGTTSLTERSLGISKVITGDTTAYGVFQTGQVQSDVTVESFGFRNLLSTAASSFTLSSYFHYAATQTTLGSGSTVSAQIGFIAAASLVGATTNYGFRGLIPAGTNRWNLFMDGTANNHMAGSLGIGTTSLTGINFSVSKNLTGAVNAFSIQNNPQIQSDVTNSVQIFRSIPSTQADSFTLGTLRHYEAAQGTIGAGSAIVSQIGYSVDSSLTGATNNYGFYGNIASGLNRWNLYMLGTAPNHMAGSLGIGTTVLTGYNLRIAKNITGAASSFGIAQIGSNAGVDATTQAVGFYTGIGVVASASIPLLNHYVAGAGSFNGSTVTSQAGFLSDASLIGATNNYGFLGSIPAGTNRWNIFMDGTADNYFNGSVGIGVAIPTTKLDVRGQVSANLGSLTNPAYSFVGDLNTGMYSPSADALALVTAGVNRVHVDSSGNVGIGTTTPSSTSELHVNNTVGNSVRFQNTYFSNPLEASASFARGGIFNNAEYIDEGGATKIWKIRAIGANDAAGILFGNSGTLNFISVPNTANADKSLTHAELLTNSRMTILATGLVGINTTSPATILDVRGQVSAESGSLTNPAYSFVGDLNTGMYSPSADALALVTAGVNRVHVDSSGRVGIGTTSPSQSLHVAGNTRLGERVEMQPSRRIGAGLDFGNVVEAGSGYLEFYNTSTGNTSLVNTTNFASITLHTNNLERFRILANGNVGIGTPSPSTLLDVRGQVSANSGSLTNPAYSFVGDLNTGMYSPSADALALVTNGVNRLNISNVGDVNIGGAAGTNSLIVNKSITGAGDASGIRSSGQLQSDVTGSGFLFRAIVNQANYATTSIYAYASGNGVISGTGTNLINYLASANSAGFTNVYGFQGTIAAGTNRWNLFMNGTANNHMAGSLGIGTTLPLTLLDVRGQVSANLGSLTNPAYSFVGDLNTGMYSPSADALALVTAGANRVHVDSSGNVGIGTTSPTQKLEIHGGNDVGISIFNTAANYWDITNGLNGTLNFIRGRSNNYLHINQIGNVGIGTTSPSTLLDVRGQVSANSGSLTNPAYSFVGDLNTGMYSPSADALALVTGGTNRVHINSSGNIGIGTVSPSEKLEVVGTVLARGGLGLRSFVDGSDSISSQLYIANVLNNRAFNFQMSADNERMYLFAFNGTSWNNRLTFHNNGNVGIGTPSPSTLLDVRGQVSANLGSLTNPAYSFVGDLNTGMYSPSADALALVTAGVNRVHIDSSGKVGIGTVTPATLLNLENGSLRINNDSTDGSTNSLQFGVNWANIYYDATTSPESNRGLIFKENLSNVRGFIFKTYGGVNAWVDTLRIAGAGIIVSGSIIGGGGPAGPPGPTQPTYTFAGDLDTGIYRQAADTISISTNGFQRLTINNVGLMSVAGSATFTGDVTANTSDERLKDNIRVIDNPLEKLSKINGVYFNWNDTAKDLIHKSNDIEEVGFLAQEVQSVLPHIVKPAPFDIDVLTGESKSGENYLTIQYEKIVPLLVEAIKELKKQVDELKNK